MLLAAIVGFITATAQCQARQVEATARSAADEARLAAERDRDAAELRAADERARRVVLEEQKDSIRKFIEAYRDNLTRIGDAQNRLIQAREIRETEPEGVVAAENDLMTSVSAFSKFIQDWQQVHDEMAELLNGDVRALDSAARERRFSEVSRRRQILEQNLNDKRLVLEEHIRTLEADDPIAALPGQVAFERAVRGGNWPSPIGGQIRQQDQVTVMVAKDTS